MNVISIPDLTTAARAKTLGLLLFCGTVIASCVDESRDSAVAVPVNNPSNQQPMPDPEFDVPAMLVNLADEVLIPNYAAAVVSTAALADDAGPLAAYCGAIGGADEVNTLDAARDAWREAMADVQAIESHALGPVLDNGEALRNRIHSYANDTISRCGIDQAAVLAGGDGFEVTSRSINQRGMGAIEYLIFNEDLQHNCAPQVPTTQGWNALTEAERRGARCGLALDIADDVAGAAQTVLERWENDGYRATFIAAGDAGNTLQMVTDALFFIEDGKDKKLSVPLGLIAACSQQTCPESIESPFSETSLSHLRKNTETFLTLFNGGAGAGFDDLIIDRGFPDVATRFQVNAAAVIAAIDANAQSLSAQVAAIDSQAAEAACANAAANPDSTAEVDACVVAGLLKRITDDLKIDFVTIVEVAIPGRVQSDND